MSVDLGDRIEDSTIHFMWSTNAADGSSITRATDGTVSVYKNDNLTQSVVGITDTEDFDSLTGIHLCKIDTSADAFYASAEDYTVVLSGATIDGKSVNAVLAVFSIENRFMRGTNSAALNADKGDWATATVVALNAQGKLDVNAECDGALSDYGANTTTPPTVAQIRAEMDANSTKMAPSQTLADYKATGFNTVVPDAAGVAPTAAEIKTEVEQVGSSLAQILTDTGTTLPARFTGVEGATFDTGTDSLEAIRNRGDDAWTTGAGGSAPTVGEIRTEMEGAGYNLATILADTADLQGNQANWATATGFNTTTPPTVIAIRQEMDANSTKMAPSQTLADYKATGFNTVVPDAAGIAATPAEVATALSDIHLDQLLAVDYDPASKPGVATALLNELIESDGGVSRYTANALEQAPSAGTNPNVLIDTTIAGVTDQTHFTLTAGSNDDDAYKDQAIVIYDASDSDYPSIRVCSGYVGATKTVTLDSTPDFTIVPGDGAKAFVTAPGTTAPTVGQIRAEMEGAGYNLALILADTDDLQGNQGAWATATGFSVPNEYDARIADIPTVAEFNARTLLAAGYFDPAADAVANVTLVATTTTNTDMRGTDGANTTVPDAAGVAPTTAEIKTAIEIAGSHLALIKAQTDLVTSARMGTLTDWINGGRLDLLLDAIPTTAMRGTDGANTTVPDVAGTAAGLHTTTDGKIDALDDITVADIIAGVTDGTLDLQEMMRIILAATAGKSSGGGTVTLVFRDAADAKARITATVDENGNRTAMTLDGS